MSQQLTPGGNAALPDGPIAIRITSGADIDVAAYRLTAAGKVRGDGDMIFYGQKQSDDGSVQFSGSGRDSLITLDPARQPAVIERIAIAYSAARPTAQLGDIRLSVEVRGEAVITCPLDSAGRSETALILAECYRRNGAWKIRFVAQGYNGGLKPLSEHFGVDIADEPAPAAKPAPAPAARTAPQPEQNHPRQTQPRCQPRQTGGLRHHPCQPQLEPHRQCATKKQRLPQQPLQQKQGG